MIPLYVKALYDIDLPENRDSDFYSPYLEKNVSPAQQWSEWINLKGVAMGSPVIDEANIRSKVLDYAQKVNLITPVQKFFMDYPQDWFCRAAVGQKSVLETAIICGITESIATGNPAYPLFDIRNTKKECKGWWTCQKYGGMNRWAMNNAEVKKLFRANTNRTNSVRGNWRWTECNKYDGWTIKDEFMNSEIGPNSTVHI